MPYHQPLKSFTLTLDGQNHHSKTFNHTQLQVIMT